VRRPLPLTAPSRGTRIMARKKSKPLESGFALFDVLYEDARAARTGGSAQPAGRPRRRRARPTTIEEQDQAIAERAGGLASRSSRSPRRQGRRRPARASRLPAQVDGLPSSTRPPPLGPPRGAAARMPPAGASPPAPAGRLRDGRSNQRCTASEASAPGPSEVT
jgi:hypothetical protein